MAGLLDIINPGSDLLDPNQQQAVGANAALTMGANMLAGSGWSPHPVSFGSIVGQSALSTLAQQQQLTANLLQMQRQRYELDMQRMMMPFRQAAINQLTGQPQNVAPPPSPTATDIQGNQFPTNTLPPYLQPGNPNAAANAEQTIQAQQSQQPTINLGGQYFTPAQLFKQGQAYSMLGIPGGPEMMNIAISHDPNVAASMAAATAQATLPYDAMKNILHGAGRNVVVSPGQRAISGASLLPPQLLNMVTGGQPQPYQPQAQPISIPQGQPAPSGYTPPPMRTGGQFPTVSGTDLKTAEEQKAFGTENVQMVKDINTQAAQSMSDKARNLQMLDVLNRGDVSLGPVSGRIAWTENLLKEMLPPSQFDSLQKNFGVKDPTNTQEFNKYAYQGAISVAKQAFGGRISTKEVEMTINAMPGNNLTDKANRAMLLFDNMKHDRNLSQQITVNQWRQSGKPLENFPSWFNQTFPYGNVVAPQTAVPNMGGVPQPAANSGFKFLGFK